MDSQHLLYDDAKVRLGDLTVLEKPLNIIAGNSFLARKLPEYKKSKCHLTSTISKLPTTGISSSIAKTNARLKAFDQWSTATIVGRQEILGALALGVWRTTKIDGSDWE